MEKQDAAAEEAVFAPMLFAVEDIDRCDRVERAWRHKQEKDNDARSAWDVPIKSRQDALTCQEGCVLRHPRLVPHCVTKIHLAQGREAALRESGSQFREEAEGLEAWCAENFATWADVPSGRCRDAEDATACEKLQATRDAAFKTAKPLTVQSC